jgi:hypothetical protein
MGAGMIECKEREKRVFELSMESFLRAWAPNDPCERAQFDTQLFSLVRQIYQDAQEPVLKQLGEIGKYTTFGGHT